MLYGFFMRPRGDVCRSVFDICVRYVRTAKDVAVLLRPKHYTSILRYDEKISTVYLRLESTPNYSSRKIHPPEFGLKWLLGQASSDPVFLKDQRNLERFSSSEQWFCTSPAKSCPIWTRYAKDYLFGVRGSIALGQHSTTDVYNLFVGVRYCSDVASTST